MQSRELSYVWVLIILFLAVSASVVAGQPWLSILAPLAVIMLCLLPFPRLLYYALLFSIPFSAEVKLGNALGTDLPDEALMWLNAVVVVFVMLRERQRLSILLSHPIVILILLSWLWSWASMANAENTWLALKFILAKTWYLLPFLFGTALLLDKVQHLRVGVVLVVVPMVLLCLVSLYRHGLHDFNFEKVSDVVRPYFRNHVNYGALLVCCIPPAFLLWRNSRKTGWLMALMVLLVALYFSYSRGAWLALAIALVAVWLLRRKWLVTASLAVSLGVTVAGIWLVKDNNYLRFRPDYEQTIYHADLREHMQATYSMKDMSTVERFYRWIAAVRMSVDHLLTGAGPNHFVSTYRSYTVGAFRTYVSNNPEGSTVHNYFLLLLSEQGIPGLLLFLFTLFAMLASAQRTYMTSTDIMTRQIVSCTVAVLAMVVLLISLSDLVETDKIGPVFYICAAVLVSASSGAYVQRVPESVAQQVE